MSRKIQIGALFLGMLLVGVERFTAYAAGGTRESVAPKAFSGGTPLPPPDHAR